MVWQPNLPHAFLVAAGDAGHLEHLKSVDRAAAHIIGIDAGADALVAVGIMPDAVMGDMDSARGKFENIVHLADDQNQSDLEKSIVYLLTQGVNDFTIYGALGGARMDQQIANVDLLAKYAPQCRIALISEDGTMTEGLSPENTAPDGLDFTVQPGGKIGILPHCGFAIVTLRGTRYDLNKGEIQFGTHGVGNTAIDDTVHIQIHKGIVRFIRSAVGA
jgi:thiamine pyrophosphokinase